MIQNKNKLNQLYNVLLEGAIVPSRWLQNKGYSRQLIYNYVQRGWLKSVGCSYCRPTTEVNWQGLVSSWQNIVDVSCHIGGETALSLQGLVNYLRLSGEVKIDLFSKSILPTWVRNVKLKESINCNSVNLFNLPDNFIGILNLPGVIKGWFLKVSSPERAILELLLNVKDDFSFNFASELMESLTTLRPELVNELLYTCNNIRIKRLFLFMADYYKHAWFNLINKEALYLGSGKRLIVKGGKLDKKYLITIPRQFYVGS